MEKKSRKELLEEYKQVKTYMGVYQVKNNSNGKIYIDSFANLKSKWLTLQMHLNEGKHPNAQLQKEWKEFGPQAFGYEVLEEKDVEKVADKKWELKQMEKEWMEKLQPYGDKGYNKPPRE